MTALGAGLGALTAAAVAADADAAAAAGLGAGADRMAWAAAGVQGTEGDRSGGSLRDSTPRVKQSGTTLGWVKQVGLVETQPTGSSSGPGRGAPGSKGLGRGGRGSGAACRGGQGEAGAGQRVDAVTGGAVWMRCGSLLWLVCKHWRCSLQAGMPPCLKLLRLRKPARQRRQRCQHPGEEDGDGGAFLRELLARPRDKSGAEAAGSFPSNSILLVLT